MNRKALLFVLAPLLLTTRTAWGFNVDAKDRAARSACLSGDYAKGVALLIELFVVTKDPTYIYNQGRCYEQNQRYDDAIARFQEYLRAGKRLSRDEKADAQKHIADCKELLASRSTVAATAPAPAGTAAAAAPPPPPALPNPPPQPAAAATAPAAAGTAVPTPPPSPPVARSTVPQATAQPLAAQVSDAQPARVDGSGLRAAGVITAGIGAAAVITAVILNVKVNSMADSIQQTDGYTPSKESERKTYQTMGWAGYGVGAACLAAGATLYVLGSRSSSGSTPSVELVPAVGPGQAGAFVKGAF